MAANKRKASVNTTVSNKKNYCSPKSRVQYISEDEYSLKFYRNLHSTLFENRNLNFVEKSIMISLMEMSRRPDEASPFSRLQVYLRLNGKTYYYDFTPKDVNAGKTMPFLKGLDHLSRTFIPNQSLSSIASTLDGVIPQNIGVSLELESFLRENRQNLASNDSLTSIFFKGDELLTRYETFNRVNYRSIVDQYNSRYANNKDYDLSNFDLNANKSTKEKFETNCNYDLQKESTLQDDILDSDKKKSHYIGFSEGDDFFLAVSSSRLNVPVKTLPKLGYFMQTTASQKPLPICEFKGKNQDIVLFSNDGRNPIQHLQHLEAYEIDQIDSIFALNELLNFSRHLFLTNPDRILYESKRGRKAQLDFFLKMNFPIYHIENLGNIFGHATFKNESKIDSTLYSDDRSSARLWCKE